MKDKYRREGKGRRCCLGDVREGRTNHLAARKKVFGRITSISEDGGLTLCELYDHPFFLKASIPPSNRYSIHPFLQIKIASAARNLINSVPQTSATSFAFSSKDHIYPSSMTKTHQPGLYLVTSLERRHILVHNGRIFRCRQRIYRGG